MCTNHKKGAVLASLQVMFARWKRLPTHWKVLFGGQGLITFGIVYHRLQLIREAKAQRELLKAEKIGKEALPDN